LDVCLVTEGLIRKRAEHNEGELTTLEEVSLHQQDIEK
jgi:protein TilB